jgi:ribosome assembly protein YihI (activator of Der GTPase)
MPRKKSRKVGRIGIPKSNEPRTINTAERPKTKKGNKSGSRQQIAESILASAKKEKKDPRSGSKEPIDLSKYTPGHEPQAKTKVEAEPIKYKTPQEELDAIEADTELEALLEKQDLGKLKASEQAYVDKVTARYRVLCELMGIDVDSFNEDDDIENEHEDDPFSKLDAIKLDDYKD